MEDKASKLREIEYRPALPQSYQPGIGLIGCGGITRWHLKAYQQSGFKVVAFCDLDAACAKSRRDEYYPDADVETTPESLLARDDVHVADITTHPQQRPPLIRAALEAGKHVLSQKPFVIDLDEGERLCDLADRQGLRLAVNQNGRWAPHFAYAREATRRGVIGDVLSAHLSVHWSHAWVKGTPFENVRHLILFDYAIHWFDMLSCLHDEPAVRVYASTAKSPAQEIDSPLLAQALIEYDRGQSTLVFDADTPVGAQERMFIAGSRGSIRSTGRGNNEQRLTIETADSEYSPNLEGRWFPDGFRGTMGELLCSIEENRPTTLNGRDNLCGLALCFAAVQSSLQGQPVRVGDVRRLPE